MSALDANIDILLIENKELQDSSRSLSLQLSCINKKYNSLLSVLQTQYSFMNDIELRMNMIMKRNKPLKDDLKRIRQERNQLREQNISLSKDNDILKSSKERLEKENLWLLEQIELSRRVGKDMESLLSTRMNMQSLNDLSNSDEKIQTLQRENTKLQVENQTYLAKIQRLEHEINRTANHIKELRNQVLKEQEKYESVKRENNLVKQQMIQIISSRQKENEVSSFNQVAQAVDSNERNLNIPLVEKIPFDSSNNKNLPDHEQNHEKEVTSYTAKQREVLENIDLNGHDHLHRASSKPYENLSGAAKMMIEAKRSLQSRKRSSSPSNPFFPIRKVNEMSIEAISEINSPSSVRSSPDKSTFLEQPTFLIQEALESKKAMESLDSKIKNLENMF